MPEHSIPEIKVIPDILTPFFPILVDAPLPLIALDPLGNIIHNAIDSGCADFGTATSFFGAAFTSATPSRRYTL